jgi:exodeoxyribonuclease-3
VFGQKTYNGVAVLSRTGVRDIAKNIAGFEDEHSRVVAVSIDSPVGEVRVMNGYFVNGQAPGTDKFDYKMRVAARPAATCARSWRHPRLVLVGDFNITPEDRDSYDPVGLRETIHHTTEEREHFRRLLAWGWSTASACSSSRRRATAGGTTGCWATRRTAACASTTCW